AFKMIAVPHDGADESDPAICASSGYLLGEVQGAVEGIGACAMGKSAVDAINRAGIAKTPTTGKIGLLPVVVGSANVPSPNQESRSSPSTGPAPRRAHSDRSCGSTCRGADAAAMGDSRPGAASG